MPRPLFSLSPRMEAAARGLSGCRRVADIGSDHAKLPAWLLKTGRAERVYAVDISPFSVEKARGMALRYGLEGKLIPLLGDGLAPLSPDLVDGAVIAGMGGDTITSILNRAPWIFSPGKRLVIQCMSSPEVLEEALLRASARVLREEIILDSGRYYTVLTLEGADAPEIGALPTRFLLKDPLCPDYLEREVRLSEVQLSGLARKREPREEDIRRLRRRLSTLTSLKEELNHESSNL